MCKLNVSDFMSLGFNRVESSILLYFFQNKDKEIYIQDLKKIGIRQSEVCLSFPNLMSFIERRKDDSETPGRPAHIYKLKIGAIDEIYELIYKTMESMESIKEKLELLTREWYSK